MPRHPNAPFAHASEHLMNANHADVDTVIMRRRTIRNMPVTTPSPPHRPTSRD